MPNFATKESVRIRLGLESTDTRRDAEIDHALSWADRRIAGAFEACSEGVPDPVPDAIRDIAADFATFFCLRNKNVAVAEIYFRTADNDLKAYLERYKSRTLL